MILRPHHGMCLFYFAGHGYNREFTAHMSQLKAELALETSIQLLAGTDAVCAACPNNLEGLCEKPELVAAYDRKVLALCGLKEGQILPYGVFAELIQEHILKKGLRKNVCGNCQWSDYC